MNEETFNPLSYPIMLSVPTAISGVSSWMEHIPFAFLLMQLTRPATFVELGTYCGDSYLAVCQAATQLQLPTRCWAVDTWVGDVHSGFYGPEVLQWLRSKHDGVYSTFSTLLQSDFDAACAKFQPGQIDLLHIDGLHTYDAVKHDFETWRPKLSPRAVVLFHDTCVKTRNFGVWKLWEELSPQYPSFEFHHGWGLGVLAVGRENAPAELLRFLNFAGHNAQMVRIFFSVLGDRIQLMNNVARLATTVTEQSLHFAQACRTMGLPWDLPVDVNVISNNLVDSARAITQQIAAVMRDVPKMRTYTIQLEAELQRLRGNPPGPGSAA